MSIERTIELAGSCSLFVAFSCVLFIFNFFISSLVVHFTFLLASLSFHSVAQALFSRSAIHLTPELRNVVESPKKVYQTPTLRTGGQPEMLLVNNIYLNPVQPHDGVEKKNNFIRRLSKTNILFILLLTHFVRSRLFVYHPLLSHSNSADVEVEGRLNPIYPPSCYTQHVSSTRIFAQNFITFKLQTSSMRLSI